MPLYRIADVIVEMSPSFSETAYWYEPYRIDEDAEPQMSIVPSFEDMDYLVKNGKDITEAVAENIILCNMFNHRLLKYYGSYIHSSALKYNDKVYLFSGPSGEGKSTHTRKWCRLFPDKTRVINDDKPSFRIIDGKCIVYGTPFAGGTDIQLNDSAELGAIVFIERSQENRLVRLDNRQAITEIMKQTPKRYSSRAQSRLLSMYSDIITAYPVYKLYCENNDGAVEAAFEIVNNS